MITLILYCVFSYIFMCANCIAWFERCDDFGWRSSVVFILLSPIIMPFALGYQFFIATEMKG